MTHRNMCPGVRGVETLELLRPLSTKFQRNLIIMRTMTSVVGILVIMTFRWEGPWVLRREDWGSEESSSFTLLLVPVQELGHTSLSTKRTKFLSSSDGLTFHLREGEDGSHEGGTS